MIKILIVDDSLTETIILKKIFEAEKDFVVVGCATNGEEAVQMTARLKPDLITMDIIMPVMDGFEATRKIMSLYPTPIIVISSKLNDVALNATFRALEAGALTVIDKPHNINTPEFSKASKYLTDVIRSMTQVHVIKRHFYLEKKITSVVIPPEIAQKKYELVLIGTSVGGPQVLKFILSKLPKDFPIPILVVQHMTPGFISGFAKWLNEGSALNIKLTEDYEILEKGNIYFAPDNYHLIVENIHGHYIARLVKGPPTDGFCPSVTELFKSAAKACGDRAIGLLLTGMGSDGAEGLLQLKKANSHTLIQDAQSAVVYGMAGVAKSLNACDKIIELAKIPEYLVRITKFAGS